MLKQSIQKIIHELEELVRSNLPERYFQDFFEKNTYVFSVLNFHDVIPAPYLHLDNGEVYVPDFMAMDFRGIWHIIELKTPRMKVHSQTLRRRATVYRAFDTYLSQCDEYLSYFQDSRHRASFDERYQTSVQKNLNCTLIGGRDSNIDKCWLHDFLRSSRSAHTILVTYDDVLSILKATLNDLDREQVEEPGITGGILFTPLNSEFSLNDEHYLLTAGKKDNYFISIGYSAEYLFLRIKLEEYTNEVRVLFPFAELSKSRLIPVYFSVSFAESATFIQVNIDETLVINRVFDPFSFRKNELYEWSIGANVDGSVCSDCRMYECVLYSVGLSAKQINELYDYFRVKYEYYFAEERNEEIPGVLLNKIGIRYVTSGHPDYPGPIDNKELKGPVLALYSCENASFNGVRIQSPNIRKDIYPPLHVNQKHLD